LDKAESWLYKALHYRFRDATLFEQALTHRSATGRNNERLEFLGDAVLDFVISDCVFKSHPDASEGDLSKLRSSLVKDTSLAGLASELGLGEFLILGSGDLEAIFGAVYLDSGYEASKEIIEQVFAQRLENLPDVENLRDPKTRLQEWMQARKFALPNYELADVSGKAHQQKFVVTCTVNELSQTTHGESTTRRKAEQKAARAMLKILSGERP
jgi:ribonuclease-3